MEKEYLEIIVRRKQNDMRVKKIVSVECKPALDKGENFMSTLLRYKLVVLLGSGETAVKHLIVKSLPDTEDHSAFLQEYSFFKNEIHVYSKILRDMMTLMEEFQDKRDQLWCEMAGYKPYHKLILQDLKDHQFHAQNRRETLDMQHSMFALKALARFHAMSAVLLKRSLLRPGEFEPYVLSKEKMVKCVFVACMKVLGKGVKQSWGDEWSHLPELFNKAVDEIYNNLQKLIKPDESRFNVLNHGDCWTNNMLFRHVEDTNIPSAIRFVDYQLSHYNSFAWDVTYFLYTSIQPTIRREKFVELLTTYHKALCYNLKLFHYPESDIPTIQQCMDEMERIKYFGALVLLSVYAITTADNDEPFDMDKNLKNEDDPEAGVNMKIYTDPKYREAVKDDLKDFIKEGLL
uniref:Putative ecdysteroid kinase n=1 Tax=Triatoma infestans TaxID=30076 RepID=A0A023F6I7_TRIIF